MRLTVPGIRVESLLNRDGRFTSWIVREIGERRQRSVLRLIDESPLAGSLAGVLRADAVALASLQTPTFIAPSRFGVEARDRPFVLRPFVDGVDFASVFDGRETQGLARWFLAVARAVAVLHRQGIAHGNLSPPNIIVPREALRARRAGGPRVVLVDPEWRHHPSRLALGEAFRAPELALDPGRAPSPAADVWSLGAIFYRLLCGEPPRAPSGRFPDPPSELRKEIPVDLERIVMSALHPDPERRPGGAESIVEALESFDGASGENEGKIVGLESGDGRAALCGFVGRDEPWRRACRVLANPARPRLIVLSGEGGMGRSAFLARLAFAAQIEGYVTSELRCFPEHPGELAVLRTLVAGLARRSHAPPAMARKATRLVKEAAAASDPPARRHAIRELASTLPRLAGDRPWVLLIDDAHFAPSILLELLAEIVRDISAAERDSAAARPMQVHLVLSIRSEPSFRTVLSSFDSLLSSARATTLPIELEPLSGEEVDRWLERSGYDPSLAPSSQLPSALSGNPFAVREALRLAGDGVSALSGRDANADLHRRYLDSLDAEARELLEILCVIGRPSTPALLATIAGKVEAAIESRAALLLGEGTLVAHGGELAFRHGSLPLRIRALLPEAKARALHGRIARALEARGASLDEVARHALRSDRPHASVDLALSAARALAHKHRDREALRLYEPILELLPSDDSARRREVAIEAAELLSRTGEHRRAIRILGEHLTENGFDAGCLHGRVGYYYLLAGDLVRAHFHLEKGLALIPPSQDERSVRERARIENELAELALSRNETAAAVRIAEGALEEIEDHLRVNAGAALGPEKIAILTTLANVRLRQFRYDEARAYLERLLEESDDRSSVSARSLAFNSLGVLCGQEDRYEEAIHWFERARELAMRLDQAPTVVTIDANLAVLFAKLGDGASADEALRRAARLDARCESARTRFLRLHAAGTVDLLLGRLESAIHSLTGAIIEGEELGDRHVLPFDYVYLAECHLLRGEWTRTISLLERALACDATSTAIGPMVEARRLVVDAFAGRAIDEERAVREAGESSDLPPYVRASNLIFIGWALRVAKLSSPARASLDSARRFFARVKVRAGEARAEIELALLDLESGRLDEAAERVDRVRGAALERIPGRNPILAALTLGCAARIELAAERPDFDEARSLLVEAESFLVGHRLPFVETLLREVRRDLHRADPNRSLLPGLAPRARSEPAGVAELLETLESLRAAASELVELSSSGSQADLARRARDKLAAFEERARELRRSIEGADPPCLPQLAGSSPALRRVMELARRIARTDLPVLITGETGTGKELVARWIHAESPRGDHPFVSVNCAALPEALLEAELFGHVRGAFSGADRDHPGLLASARGGSFLFDEIAEMPLALQAKLLRLLDRKAVRPVGAVEEVEIDVRFLAATNRDLEVLVASGEFRRELYFRLQGARIEVPPLRERMGDLPALFAHFATAAGVEPVPRLEDDALRFLSSYPWPGNVRELENLTLRLVLGDIDPIRADDVRPLLSTVAERGLFPPTLLRSRPFEELATALEREYLLQLREDRGGDLKVMAKDLGITLRALYKRFQRLGIPTSRHDEADGDG